MGEKQFTDSINFNTLILIETELERRSEKFDEIAKSVIAGDASKKLAGSLVKKSEEQYMNMIDRLASFILHNEVSFLDMRDEYYEYFGNINKRFKTNGMDRSHFKNIEILLANWGMIVR